MVKKFFFFVLLFGLGACSSSSNSYTILGTIADSSYNGQIVYIKSYAKEVVIASTVIENGKFTLKGNVNNSEFCMMKIEDAPCTDFILEQGTIRIDVSDISTVSGTAKNDKFQELFSEMRGLYGKLENEKMSLSDSLSALELEKLEGQIIDKLEHDYATNLLSVMKDNSNNALGFFTLWIAVDFKNNIKYFDSLYVHAGDSLRTNPRIMRVAERFNLIKETMPGKKFKDFTVPKGNLDGTDAKLSDYVGKGKYVLVDFWAQWCGPCKDQIPYLKELYEKYKGDKFDVLSVAVWDKKEETIAEIEKSNLTWSHIVDAQDIPVELYGFSGIPQILLIAPDGTIIARDLYGAGIVTEVDKAMSR